MSVKKYIKTNYGGSEQTALINLYQKYQGILSGNFYHWENEFKDQSYEQQLGNDFLSFLNKKIEQVLADAKKIREEELAKEAAERAKEEEAWEDGSQ